MQSPYMYLLTIYISTMKTKTGLLLVYLPLFDDVTCDMTNFLRMPILTLTNFNIFDWTNILFVQSKICY